MPGGVPGGVPGEVGGEEGTSCAGVGGGTRYTSGRSGMGRSVVGGMAADGMGGMASGVGGSGRNVGSGVKSLPLRVFRACFLIYSVVLLRVHTVVPFSTTNETRFPLSNGTGPIDPKATLPRFEEDDLDLDAFVRALCCYRCKKLHELYVEMHKLYTKYTHKMHKLYIKMHKLYIKTHKIYKLYAQNAQVIHQNAQNAQNIRTKCTSYTSKRTNAQGITSKGTSLHDVWCVAGALLVRC